MTPYKACNNGMSTTTLVEASTSIEIPEDGCMVKSTGTIVLCVQRRNHHARTNSRNTLTLTIIPTIFMHSPQVVNVTYELKLYVVLM